MRNFVSRLFPLVAVVLTACGGGDGGTNPPPPAVELGSIVPSSATLALTAGQSQTIAMTARDLSNNPIASASGYVFTSSNPSIAIVSGTGQVTALSAGTAQINVSLTLSGKTATASVAVTVSGSLPNALTVAAGAGSNDFTPASAAIARAGTVTYTFGARVHNVRFGGATGAPADVNDVSNSNVTRQFNSGGTFSYTCTLHQGMNGVMLVP